MKVDLNRKGKVQGCLGEMIMERAAKFFEHVPGKGGIPRLKNDKGYFAGLGYAVAAENVAVWTRTGFTIQELQKAYRKYQRKPTKAFLDGVKLAVDPLGKHKINPKDWMAVRVPEGYLFLERKHFEDGLVLVHDQGTVKILDQLMPGLMEVKWIDETSGRHEEDPKEDGGGAVNALKPLHRSTSCIFEYLKGKTSIPTYETLVKDLQISSKTVAKGMRELEEHGLLPSGYRGRKRTIRKGKGK